MSDMLATTVGFEAEFEAGAADVMRYLYREHDLVGSETLHRYHCDDEACSDYPLKGQTDSSCSGEIISQIITEWDMLVELTDALQEAAVETDAVPGMRAGFHVHIGRPDRGGDAALRRNSFFEVLRYENVLSMIARGRFEVQRSNNTAIHDAIHGTLVNEVRGPWITGLPDEWYANTTRYAWYRAVEWIRHQASQPMYKDMLYRAHRESDRHNNLNVRTRFNTWEFRFYNSTRSAWRMRMFVGLSMAFANPQFVAHLMNCDGIPSDDPVTGVEQIIDALNYADLNTTADLVDRQKHYMVRMDNGSITVPYEFTVA